MGKILCECGYVHSDTCGYDGYIFKEDEWTLPENEQNPLSVLECHKCGNILIDDPKDGSRMLSYIPLSHTYNKILHEKSDDTYE